MKILRQRSVRLIAINDGVDSLNGDDDFAPFHNIMNEFYARDTSRKIRSVFKTKGMSGKHLPGTVIYGYLWDKKREYLGHKVNFKTRKHFKVAAETAGRRPKAGRRTGKGDCRLRAEPEISGEIHYPDWKIREFRHADKHHAQRVFGENPCP